MLFRSVALQLVVEGDSLDRRVAILSQTFQTELLLPLLAQSRCEEARVSQSRGDGVLRAGQAIQLTIIFAIRQGELTVSRRSHT